MHNAIVEKQISDVSASPKPECILRTYTWWNTAALTQIATTLDEHKL